MVAVDGDTCDGCVFNGDEEYCYTNITGNHRFNCKPHEMDDGRSIIWVVKEMEE